MKCIIFARSDKGILLANLLNSARIQSGIDLTAYFDLPKKT